ncbi:MAG: 4Fe-4S binding protein [Actinomycetota bacterium]|nr:4Fe-4S binding protein [Actinomycetota bacterium]MDD5667665.1 4Fe-4S binding protein [Actinomycetota bacterium]
MIRKIIQIDEEKCDGCGLCASACSEGAIRMVGGKARLVSDTYCDGLGACIGECPQGAITIVEREAAEFDEAAVERHLAAAEEGERGAVPAAAAEALACGCPGSMIRELDPAAEAREAAGDEVEGIPSHLRNWPVQMHLVPQGAPYLDKASLLLAADCVGFAYPDFHRGLLAGKTLIVGCPKLDDAAFYREKLASILRENDIRELTVAYMEVPCCSGLVNLARQALRESGKDIPFRTVKVGIQGELLEDEKDPPALRV